eukprot:1136895-Pelagomonas_calceolata.AAC.1
MTDGVECMCPRIGIWRGSAARRAKVEFVRIQCVKGISQPPRVHVGHITASADMRGEADTAG